MKCAFLQGDMDEQHVDDNDDADFNVDSAQTCVRHLLRTSSRVDSKVATGTSTVWSLSESRVRIGQRSEKMASDLRHMEKAKNLILLMGFRRKWCYAGLVLGVS